MLPSLGRAQFRLYIALLALLLSLFALFSLHWNLVVASSGISRIGLDGKPDKTAIQHDSPPEKPPYGAVVVAAQSNVDLSWTTIIRTNWTLYEYDVNQPHNLDPQLRFPQRKGHEAMVYLSYIIDNYENLPWSSIFIHGHFNDSWHQEDKMIRMITNLNRKALARQGYISFRCDWYPSCPAEIQPSDCEAVVWGSEALRKATQAAINGNWKLLFPDKPLPHVLASPCCAQFEVTRRTITRRSKTDYERFRDWLVSTLLEDAVSGRVFEKLWAYIFLGKAQHCPPMEVCACEWFDRCGATTQRDTDSFSQKT